MRLIVAEKPSVARDIARVLGVNGRGQGYLGRGDVRVTWCVGHLVELAEPAAYNPEWRSWRLESLPMLPEAFQLQPRKSSTDQWRIVKALMGEQQVAEVVNACDAGREGELIFAYAYELAGCRAPVRRLWISSMTDGAIRQGFDRLRDGAEMTNLAAAARCRSEADWLVGLNATRAMTTRHRQGAARSALLSVGRVQTPTLAILARREEEIEAFEPQDFWQVKVVFEASGPSGEGGSYEAVWTRPRVKRDADRIFDRAEAEAIVARTAGRDGLVAKVQRKQTRERPPLLYDLTTLQKEANKRFGFTAKKTLELAQALYETHKVLTYPRTDSRHLTQDQVPTLPRALRGISFGPYEAAAQAALARTEPLGPRVVNDREVSDHHAIIPTGEDPRRKRLSVEEKRLFDLVARRFLAVYAPDAVFATAFVATHIARGDGEEGPSSSPRQDDVFLARGRTCLEAGWRRIDPPFSKKKETLLPAVEEGETVTQRSQKLHEGQTKPPKRHNEATLLSSMERAGETIEDAELKRAMKRNGLGTPATRASIIETLLGRRFAARDGKTLLATPYGRTVLAAIPVDALTSPKLTGQWEARLVMMAEGTESRADFMADIRTFTRELVDAVRRAPLNPEVVARLAPPAPTGPVLGGCPKCGEQVRTGDRGWGCACGLTIPGQVARREVSVQMAKALLKDGRTKTVKGFKSRVNKPFAAALAFDEDYAVRLDFPDPDPLGACPSCGKPVRRRGRIVTCDSGRACPFVLVPDDAGPQFTDDDVRSFLSDKPSRLERRGSRIVAVERDERELLGPVAPCPRCGGPVAFTGGRWRCGSCAFGIDAELRGRTFTVDELTVLLKRGRTPRLHGFRNPENSAVFKAAVVLEPNGRLSFDYARQPDEPERGDEKTCPACVHRAEHHPGHIITGRAAWGCSRWRQGCRLQIPFEIEGRRLTPDDLSRLVSKHRATRYLKGFGARTRTARVVLDLEKTPPEWHIEERKATKKKS